MFFAKLLGRGHIEERVGFPVESQQLILTHPVAFSAFITAAKGPFFGKSILFQNRRHHPDIHGSVGRQFKVLHIEYPSARIFDIVNVPSEPPKAYQIMQELVSDSRKGVPKHDSEYYEFAFDVLPVSHRLSFNAPFPTPFLLRAMVQIN